MTKSRLQQKYRKKTAISLLLSLLLIVGLAAGSMFYLPELILGITTINSKIFSRSQNIDANASNDTIAPSIPNLEPLSEATSKNSLTITGTSESGAKVHLYRNDSQISTTSVDSAGDFSFDDIKLVADKNEFYVVSEDFSGNKSKPSTAYLIILQIQGPPLTATGAVDNSNGKAIISGETDSSATVTVSGRRAIVTRSGSFTLELKLNSGENKLLVTATDQAGNTTEQELVLNYSPED
ncbi:hypothetical protein COW99_01360 [Candidatus Roizmanbacteria bacterium CG22_combo_CG10-13_8_21_14_all_38_20]|uniref:Bacterial Ig domain-containing protein n=1 Tax=Candidatus Roizmanbacteria bacterium CG22_combo_CG10-13_8_21_14_all_38_20 TaxID=1974862 RepID=A0A2H0BVZ3_9BACT|nr:hypothetical protein [Candidatus Microgenomates bacterium]PIP61853.1 MAG: hypothetical protein COW99_01360 [Candidatus Roizmanbacteria bacterium CG22_combo_CG10-13_8_21_14_all_38_20]PJC31944.1 MAG: hypothetical protein CO050_01595 [Candidatus Roizmanbacteria bacterium CG_4_9_14_0_2_um_filter_38_17]